MDVLIVLARPIAYLLGVLLAAIVAYKLVRRRVTSPLVALFAAVIVAAFPLWWPYVFFPLPKDEALIAHLEAHRADFETIVARYRSFTPKAREDASSAWLKVGDTASRLRKARIDYVTATPPIWLPSPYSIESGRKARELAVNAKDLLDTRRYGRLQLNLSPAKDFRRSLMFRGGPIWKRLHHFPESPRIENGRLLYPMDEMGRVQAGPRVLSSLNSYPWNWSEGQCFMRQVDRHWFISMCMGAW